MAALDHMDPTDLSSVSSPVFSKPLNHSTPNPNKNNNKGISPFSHFQLDQPTTSPIYNNNYNFQQESRSRNNNNNNNYDFNDDERSRNNGVSDSAPHLTQHDPNNINSNGSVVSGSVGESPFELKFQPNPSTSATTSANNFPNPRKSLPLPTPNFRINGENLLADEPSASASGPVFFIGSRHGSTGTGVKGSPGSVNSNVRIQVSDGENTMTNGHGELLNHSNNNKQPPHNHSSILSNEENFECFADGSESFFESTSDNTSLPFTRYLKPLFLYKYVKHT